jgi:hypothetical protein
MASMQCEQRQASGPGRGNGHGHTKGNGKKKSVVCPYCREKDEVIPILYGFPSDRGFMRAERGEVYLGGYIVGPASYYCKRDDKEF